jgi:hypothetical protein
MLSAILRLCSCLCWVLVWNFSLVPLVVAGLLAMLVAFLVIMLAVLVVGLVGLVVGLG